MIMPIIVAIMNVGIIMASCTGVIVWISTPVGVVVVLPVETIPEIAPIAMDRSMNSRARGVQNFQLLKVCLNP